MLIAITAQENSLQSEIDPKFGRAAYYLIVNTVTGEVTTHDNSDGINASNGAGTGAAQALSEYGVEALYTGKVGPKAAAALAQAKIPYYENITGTVEGLLEQLKNGAVLEDVSATDTLAPMSENSAAVLQCPGALSAAGQGLRMGKGRGQGIGRGMGLGRGLGRSQGWGRCRR